MLGKYVRSALALILLSVASVRGSAGVNQWTSSGPDGGIITSIVFDPTDGSIAYAASGPAVYKSTDGGINWTLLKDDFGNSNIYNLALDPSNHARLYVAAFGDAVYRSSDAGLTFTKISTTPADTYNDSPYALGISSDGMTIYYSTASGRFFRSTDAGQSWSERTMAEPYLRNIVVNPANSSVLYATGLKFNKSIDGGDHWTQSLPTGVTFVSSLAFLSGTPNTFWVTAGTSVYMSNNEGTSWTTSFTAPPGSAVSILAVDPNAPNTLLAASDNVAGPLFQYSGGGWTPHGIAFAVGQLAIAPGNSSTVLTTSNHGVYRTTNLGTTWNVSTKGIHSTTDRILTNSGPRTYAGHESISLGYSVNDGPWQTVSMAGIVPKPNPYFDSLAVHPTNPNTLLAGIQGNGIWRSTDGGSNWNAVASILALSKTYSIVFDPTNPNTVYATTTTMNPPPVEAVQKSVDGGLTFAPISTGLTYPFPNRLAIDPTDSKTLFLSGNTDNGAIGLLRSNDSGVTWSSKLSSTKVFDLTVDALDSKRLYAMTESGVQMSSDSGDTWSFLINLTGDTYGTPMQLAVDPTLSSNLYALSAKFVGSVGEYFIMRSVDRGGTWERIPSKLSSWAPVQLTMNASTLNTLYLAVAQRGVHTFEFAPDQSARITGHTGTKALGVPTFFEAGIQNQGPYAASDVKLAIQVPSNLQNVGVTIDRGTCAIATGAINCAIPYVRKDELVTTHVTYTPVVAGAIDIRASASAHERDPVSSNDVVNATANAVEIVDLQLASSVLPVAVTVGDVATYSVQVTNAGPSPSSANRVSLTMPMGVSITSVTPATCVTTGLAIDCNLGVLNAAAGTTIVVNVTTNSTGSLSATATATTAAGAIDANSGNNSASASLVVKAKPTPTSGGGGGALPWTTLVSLLITALIRARQRVHY